MMMYAPEMTYTGIDMEIFHDWATQFDAAPGYINDRLAQFQPILIADSLNLQMI